DGSARVPAGPRRHIVVLDDSCACNKVQEYPRCRSALDRIASHPHITREGNQRHTVSQSGLYIFDGVVFDQDWSGDPFRISRWTDPQALTFGGTGRKSSYNPREPDNAADLALSKIKACGVVQGDSRTIGTLEIDAAESAADRDAESDEGEIAPGDRCHRPA